MRNDKQAETPVTSCTGLAACTLRDRQERLSLLAYRYLREAEEKGAPRDGYPALGELN